MNVLRIAALFGAVAGTLILSQVQGQQGEKPQPDERRAEEALQGTGIRTPQQNDARIHQWVSIDCEALRKCAERAASKATNPQVKEFAELVAADHKQWKESYGKKFETSAYPPSNSNKPLVTVTKDDGASRQGRAFYRPVNFVQVKQKVCDRMEELANKYMDEIEGAEFDQVFLKHAVMGHEAAIASIDAVRGSASSELGEVLDKVKEGLNTHLTKAKELCEAHKSKSNPDK